MCTTMLNPSTTDLALAETCRLVVLTRRSTAKVARDAVAAFLAGTGHPYAVDDARTCVSDAVAYILVSGTQALHMTVTVRVTPQGVTVSVEGQGRTRTVPPPQLFDCRRPRRRALAGGAAPSLGPVPRFPDLGARQARNARGLRAVERAGARVIKPQEFSLSHIGWRTDRVYWLYFDTRLMVELKPELARELTYELAAYVGLDVAPVEPRGARAARRLRSLVRRRSSPMRRGASHARR